MRALALVYLPSELLGFPAWPHCRLATTSSIDQEHSGCECHKRSGPGVKTGQLSGQVAGLRAYNKFCQEL